MAFQTPFSSFSSRSEGPDFSYDFLRDFYVNCVRRFETELQHKLRSINLPRRSFLRPERTVQLDVHTSIFLESFGKKMMDSEIRHVPLTDKLQYDVTLLSRWRSLVGGDSSLVRQNGAGDWSLLTPLAAVSQEVASLCLDVGTLVVPLQELENGYEVFCPSPEATVAVLFDLGTYII